MVCTDLLLFFDLVLCGNFFFAQFSGSECVVLKQLSGFQISLCFLLFCDRSVHLYTDLVHIFSGVSFFFASFGKGLFIHFSGFVSWMFIYSVYIFSVGVGVFWI